MEAKSTTWLGIGWRPAGRYCTGQECYTILFLQSNNPHDIPVFVFEYDDRKEALVNVSYLHLISRNFIRW